MIDLQVRITGASKEQINGEYSNIKEGGEDIYRKITDPLGVELIKEVDQFVLRSSEGTEKIYFRSQEGAKFPAGDEVVQWESNIEGHEVK